MAESKTRYTRESVKDYLASRASEQQLSDCRTLMAMFRRITGKSPRMWGPSIVGYGSYHYTYESGRSGDAPVAAFALRGKDLVVYRFADDGKQKSLLARLGKYRDGKSCLYFRQLSDIDLPTLEEIVRSGIAEIQRRYG